jgi:lipid-A-disaccharide synthase
VPEQPSAETARIFVSTGELSGDMHAAHAIAALNTLRAELGLPAVNVVANGSTRLEAQGAGLLHDVSTWGEIGILRNFVKAPMFLGIFQETVRCILADRPDMVLLVDSRGMNLRLAKGLRRAGYSGRIVYYVSPVRWESLYDPAEHQRSLRNSRFLDLKRYCDLAIPIYPVSLEAYQELEIPHIFPGHPLCDVARPRLSDRQFNAVTGFNYDPASPPLIIGAMVGSRIGEVRDIATPVFSALRLIQEALSTEHHLPPLHFVTLLAHEELRRPLLRAARSAGLDGLELLASEYIYDVMARARVMIVKSGTGLHECVLLGVPALMCYRVAPVLAWTARHLLRFSMPFYGFPNLLAGAAVVPELIQEDCRHTLIAEQAGELLFDEQQRNDMLSSFAALRSRMCRPAVMRTIATALQEQLTR